MLSTLHGGFVENTSNNLGTLDKEKREYTTEGYTIQQLVRKHNFDAFTLRGVIAKLEGFNLPIFATYLRDRYGNILEDRHEERLKEARKCGAISFSSYDRLRRLSRGRRNRTIPSVDRRNGDTEGSKPVGITEG